MVERWKKRNEEGAVPEEFTELTTVRAALSSPGAGLDLALFLEKRDDFVIAGQGAILATWLVQPESDLLEVERVLA